MVWNKRIIGTKQFVVIEKLKLLRSSLRELHHHHFHEVVTKEQDARIALMQAQDALAADVGIMSLHSRVQECRQELSHWSRASFS